MRTRVWFDTAFGALTAVLAVVTAANAEWIEWLFGDDPDGGSGALEWALVAGLGAASLTLTLVARRGLRAQPGCYPARLEAR
jgi:hypothetical protein